MQETMRWTNRSTFQQVITFTGQRAVSAAAIAPARARVEAWSA